MNALYTPYKIFSESHVPGIKKIDQWECSIQMVHYKPIVADVVKVRTDHVTAAILACIFPFKVHNTSNNVLKYLEDTCLRVLNLVELAIWPIFAKNCTCEYILKLIYQHFLNKYM